jgi:acetyl esterase/lipase
VPDDQSLLIDDLSVLEQPVTAPDAVAWYGSDVAQCIDLRNGGRGAGSHPLIVLLHGGFWRPAYDRRHMAPMAAALAELGWSTANVEYRRMPGEPQATLDDARAAVDLLATHHAGTPNDGRMIVVGFSAGGHLALWLAATCNHSALHAALGLAPVADLCCARQLSLGDGAVDRFVGAHSSALQALDPARLPAATRSVSIVHGDRDGTVPLSVSESYVAAHPATRLIALTGAGHFALVDPHSAAWPTVVNELQRLCAADSRPAG